MSILLPLQLFFSNNLIPLIILPTVLSMVSPFCQPPICNCVLGLRRHKLSVLIRLQPHAQDVSGNRADGLILEREHLSALMVVCEQEEEKARMCVPSKDFSSGKKLGKLKCQSCNFRLSD